MKRSLVLDLALCAMFAGLISVCSLLAIPTPWGVPANLAHLGIFLAAGLMGARYGTAGTIVFVLLGTVGVPVFSEFTGGLSILLGPTGGYIFGYILTALTVGWLVDRMGRSVVVLTCAMAAGLVLTYVPGALWFYLYTPGEYSFGWVLKWCVAVYLPYDVVKIALCTVLIRRLHPLMTKLRRRPKAAV